jgi:dephospho-CoA kinase
VPHAFVPIIAVVGGVGSGKSSLIRATAGQLRAVVIDGDHIGHQVLMRPEVRDVLVETFGKTILNEGGEIDRSALGKMVFGTDRQSLQNRALLERIVHPLIKKEMQTQIDRAREQAGIDVILLDAAVILEAGWREICDAVVFLETPTELRRQRVQQQRGWSDAKWQTREASQFSLEEKRKAADFIVTNSGKIEDAGLQLHQFIRRLQRSKTATRQPTVTPTPPRRSP